MKREFDEQPGDVAYAGTNGKKPGLQAYDVVRMDIVCRRFLARIYFPAIHHNDK
jgi:hypothetical protein